MMTDLVQERVKHEEIDLKMPRSHKKKGNDKTNETLSQQSLHMADIEDNIGMLGKNDTGIEEVVQKLSLSTKRKMRNSSASSKSLLSWEPRRSDV